MEGIYPENVSSQKTFLNLIVAFLLLELAACLRCDQGLVYTGLPQVPHSMWKDLVPAWLAETWSSCGVRGRGCFTKLCISHLHLLFLPGTTRCPTTLLPPQLSSTWAQCTRPPHLYPENSSLIQTFIEMSTAPGSFTQLLLCSPNFTKLLLRARSSQSFSETENDLEGPN